MFKTLNEVKQVQIGLTTRCNSHCRFCFREELLQKLGNKNPFYKNPIDISFDSYKKIFNNTNLTDIQFCGNKGDAIFHPDFNKILNYTIDKEIFISLSTNGSNFNRNWWKELGRKMKGEVTFAIDGFEDTHHLYRNTSFKKVYDNMLSYIEGGGKARWQFIVFRHNEHQLEKAKMLSKEIGCYKFITVISRYYDDVMKKPIMNIDTKRESYRKFNKYPNIQKLLFGKVRCQWMDMKRVYVDSNGFVYPCCYICCGTQPYYTALEFINIDKILRSNECNIKYNDLNDIIKSNVFNKIYNNIQNYKTCNIHCTNLKNYYNKIRKEENL